MNSPRPMLLPSIPNLVSTSVELIAPWEFRGKIPADVRGPKAKKLRTAWMQNPDTRHSAFCGWEGLNSTLRLSDAPDGNPPYALRALVGDYESSVSPEELEAGVRRIGTAFAPMWQEASLSGYAHFVWPLEKPVLVPNRAFAVALLEFVLKEMRLEHLAIGLDVPAFTSPERYYTNSCTWVKVSDNILPLDLVSGWVMRVAEKFSFRAQGGVKIPLEVVWEEVQRKYPGVEWPGDFVVGSQGPSFFVTGSVSPKSAIVKEEGIYTFSQHATKPWWSWKDLLGAAFVSNYESRALGSAVEGIYHDGQSYWRCTGRGIWRPYTKEDTATHLKLAKGLSSQSARGEGSEVERALEHIRTWNDVSGAAPFVFRPSGAIEVGGRERVLNTFTRRVVAPADGPAKWGPDGQFPFISDFLTGLLDPAHQLDYLLAWTKRFYCGALNLSLEGGQNLFVVGPVGTGKTLFSTVLLARLIGGHAPAEDYLLGKTDFNSQLFESALWTVDDTSANDDTSTHRKFSSIVKRMAANTTFQFHAKFRVPTQVTWKGRVLVTLNSDEESIRMLPDLDISILDKLMIFRAAVRKTPFGTNQEVESTIQRELPHFARFLIDYEVPEHCRGTNRFGVVPYHEPSLVRIAQLTSNLNSFLEIFMDWRETYFAEHSEPWVGTAHQFLIELNRDAAKSAVIRNLRTNAVVNQLSAMRRKGMPLECDDNSDLGLRVWTIRPPATKPAKKSPPANSTKYDAR